VAVCDTVLMALRGRCRVTPDGATTSSYPRILGAEEASACWLSSQENIVPQVLYPCPILSQGRVGILERSNAFIMEQLAHYPLVGLPGRFRFLDQVDLSRVGTLP